MPPRTISDLNITPVHALVCIFVYYFLLFAQSQQNKFLLCATYLALNGSERNKITLKRKTKIQKSRTIWASSVPILLVRTDSSSSSSGAGSGPVSFLAACVAAVSASWVVRWPVPPFLECSSSVSIRLSRLVAKRWLGGGHWVRLRWLCRCSWLGVLGMLGCLGLCCFLLHLGLVFLFIGLGYLHS